MFIAECGQRLIIYVTAGNLQFAKTREGPEALAGRNAGASHASENLEVF